MTNALIEAIKNGQKLSKEEVGNFIAGGINPNDSDENGNPPLILAVQRGNRRSITSLLQYKVVNIDNPDSYRNTALMWAVASEDVSLVQLFLDCQASLSVRNRLNQTAEIVANLRGAVEIEGRIKDKINYLNSKLLKVFRREDPNPASCEALINRGANPNVVDQYGISVLMLAASCGEKEIVNILLNKGADTNYTTQLDGQDYTAAKIAYEQGFVIIFNQIIRHSIFHYQSRDKYRESLESIVTNQFDLRKFNDGNLMYLAEALPTEKYGEEKISDLIGKEIQRRNISQCNFKAVVNALKKASDLHDVANEVEDNPATTIRKAFDASHQGFKSLALFHKN